MTSPNSKLAASVCAPASAFDLLQWQEQGQAYTALWRSESSLPKPRRIEVADDTMPADTAFRHISEGASLLWRGDFQNARQLLLALGRRLDKKSRRKSPAKSTAASGFPHAFHLYRQSQAQRARMLGSILIELDVQWHCALRRAPDWSLACSEAWGAVSAEAHAQSVLVPLRDLLGVVGAHEWRKKGVEIPALDGARIHAHYGVFSPVRGEYLDLVARASIPAAALQQAWDIGVGTGVLSALLLKRGVKSVVATDTSERALACATENLQRLGHASRVELQHADLFAQGQAGLIVCNPPWLPGKAASVLDQAIYDEDSRMLRGFLQGLAAHLLPGGEGWLILSDLAEHLKLRTRDELLGWIDDAGLKVLGRDDVRPHHGKVQDREDPLHTARAAEVTSLWRLAKAG
ncbi:methyltransferase [Comamonas testosteroni]|uniref:Putative methyltransferase n=1 Tax=Comamonas testosteroni TaxID=285 RepID=A0A8B4S020_COMTE|nr:class I SAM-dependent methyltransferase [Comamonas testosteroni]EHN65316.1 methyltransferase small [Comamonas testosteroni ATCC 11996]QQN70021.1 class I SAM-dependent methyltransferase [Comamonas testosteroni]SUY75940.1 putative methyltransferase [Comamonas testosteroni]